MNHVKIFKGWPLQDAPLKLVKLWYKSFPQGRNYVEEKMKGPHDVVRRIRFFCKILGIGF